MLAQSSLWLPATELLSAAAHDESVAKRCLGAYLDRRPDEESPINSRRSSWI